jgi:four helix bundle protein
MEKENINDRIMTFTVRVLNMVAAMPNECTTEFLSDQVIRAIGAAGANYGAACREKSGQDYIDHLKTVEEKLDETIFWLELIRESKIFPSERLSPLITENNELLEIIVKSIATANGKGSATVRKQKVYKEKVVNT